MTFRVFAKPMIISFSIATLLVTGVCYAESYDLPQPLVSSGVTVTPGDGSPVLYGGYTGNEAVFNFNPNTESTPSASVGFSQSQINGCYENLFNLDLCFVKTLGSQPPYDIMNSKTSVNGMIGLETAALVYDKNIAEGDIFGAGTLNNFALYGRNLNLNSAATGGTWNLSGYSLNPDAQAYYNNSASSYYNERISKLKGEATLVTRLMDKRTWYLQNDNIASSTASITPSPEGRVWHLASGLSLTSGTYYYKGKGTIIIDDTLTIEPGVKILPAPSDPTAHLGIIVTNSGTSVQLSNNNELDAAVFASGQIKIGLPSSRAQNVIMRGSFVASDFIVSGSNVQVLYDFNLGQDWPPGFRYFNMPVASER